MIYYVCLNCPPHSTMDHDLNGKGACLFPDCPCQKMQEGDQFIKKPSVKVSKEDAVKAGAEREEQKPE